MVADGGTRTAAISGGYVALALALRGLDLKPARQICALSVGKLDGHLVVDLSYDEDYRAQVDLNLVMAPAGELVEVQGTAEDGLFSRQELIQMVDMALTASQAVFAAQNQALQGQ
jgi:ribonuclease PH